MKHLLRRISVPSFDIACLIETRQPKFISTTTHYLRCRPNFVTLSVWVFLYRFFGSFWSFRLTGSEHGNKTYLVNKTYVVLKCGNMSRCYNVNEPPYSSSSGRNHCELRGGHQDFTLLRFLIDPNAPSLNLAQQDLNALKHINNMRA